MTFFKRAFVVLMMALPLICVGKTSGSSSSSSRSSFSRGFSSPSSSNRSSGFSSPSSSNKSSGFSSPSSSSNAASNTAAKPSFGSFGSSRSVAPVAAAAVVTGAAATATQEPTKSTSALTSSLDKNAAQTNALKTYDANKAGTTTAAAGNTGSNAFGNSANGGTPRNYGNTPTYNSTPTYNPSVAQAPSTTTIIHHDSGSSNGLMWFMLGNSMNNNRHSDNGGYNNGGYNNNNNGGYNNGSNPNNMNQNPAVRSADSGDSFGVWFLRVLAWTLVLGALGGGVWYLMNRSKNKVVKKNNYSLD